MSLNPTHNISSKRTDLILVIALITSINYGQTTTYNQFWNEIQFNRTINEKWSAELILEPSIATQNLLLISFNKTYSVPHEFGDITTFFFPALQLQQRRSGNWSV
ncbi:hypothetical protein [Flavobacterium sp. SLB02]|uniref:hypothetical protein n=1 Tax=Flavobacterium sp. SLB02 TaxID=2665645 RepID=UPI001E4C78AB|nr:hypothetical protein [Flavobacterium sp. SLB02]